MKKVLLSIIATGLLAIAQVNAQTITPTPAPLPAELANLVGEAELMADVIATARSVQVQLMSNSQTGDSQVTNAVINGAVTNESIAKAIIDAKVSIRVSSPTEEVGLYIRLRDANERVAVYAYDSKLPVETKGGHALPKFSLKPRLESQVLVGIKGLRQVKVSSFDENGRVNGTKYLEVTPNGFYFETRMAGKVMLELTDQSGNAAVYDLRKGAQANIITLAATAVDVQLENVEFATDKAELNLIPFSTNGRGKNVLGVLTLSKATTVSIAGRTTQNVNAEGFKYRKVGESAWQTVKASPNGLASLTLAAGTWQIIPTWGAGFTEEVLYLYSEKG